MGKRGQGDNDDAALWEKVVETAAPLKRGRNAAAPKPAKIAAPVAKAKPPHGPAPGDSPRQSPRRSQAMCRAPRRSTGRLRASWTKASSRSRRGSTCMGLRQRDAHAQLRRFLKTAQARGLRHVLVITGKGAEQAASRSFYEEDERGVLRNAVPHWLAEPELAALVVSFSPAPRRLGGDGALYVRLRRPRPG